MSYYVNRPNLGCRASRRSPASPYGLGRLPDLQYSNQPSSVCRGRVRPTDPPGGGVRDAMSEINFGPPYVIFYPSRRSISMRQVRIVCSTSARHSSFTERHGDRRENTYTGCVFCSDRYQDVQLELHSSSEVVKYFEFCVIEVRTVLRTPYT
jgi:hypothetical protein